MMVWPIRLWKKNELTHVNRLRGVKPTKTIFKATEIGNMLTEKSRYR